MEEQIVNQKKLLCDVEVEHEAELIPSGAGWWKPLRTLTQVAVVVVPLCLSGLNLPGNREQEVRWVVGLDDLLRGGWDQLTWGKDNGQRLMIGR